MMDGKQFKEIAVAARLSWHKMGTKKKIAGQLGQELSEFFAADKRSIGAEKKLFDPKTEEIKKLEAIKNETDKYWRGNTYQYMEAGVRLARKDTWLPIKTQMEEFRKQIKDAEKELEANRASILEKSRAFLGDKLYNPSDYPASFVGSFDFELEPVNVDPPSYLMELDPEAYEKAQKVLEAKMDSALSLFEEQAHTGLAKMLNHLVDRMKPGEDGKKKAIHESALDNLFDFFKQYKSLKLRDNEDLDNLVKMAEERLTKFDIGGIRSSSIVRGQVVEAFEGLAKEAEKFVVSCPKRKVKTTLKEQNVQPTSQES